MELQSKLNSHVPFNDFPGPTFLENFKKLGDSTNMISMGDDKLCLNVHGFWQLWKEQRDWVFWNQTSMVELVIW